MCFRTHCILASTTSGIHWRVAPDKRAIRKQSGRRERGHMNTFRGSPRIAQYPSLGEIPSSQWEKKSRYLVGAQLRTCIAFPWEDDMHDTKERLSLFWIFALLNYLYADVLALFAFVGSPNSAPHLPQWALLGSAVLIEIPIAMILASRLLPFRANRLANIIAGLILTLVNGFLTFVLPLTNGDFRDPTFPAYVFFATIETVCTSVIIWQAWTWSPVEASS